MTPELGLANLLDAASDIADKERQERRWRASDSHAWENPGELINVILDDHLFERFLQQFGSTFSAKQRAAAVGLRDELILYCHSTPQLLDPTQVLADPRWEMVRQKAAAFVAEFKQKWPTAPATSI
jgi:hypothetical protein